jgi:hypothetical protein
MNRSKPVFAGRPLALTVIVSVWPCVTTRTLAAAFGRQFAATAALDRTIVKVMLLAAA